MDSEVTEMLIETVKKYEFLYNTAHESYKKFPLKRKKWAEIGSTLNMSGDAARKTWQTLKDRYVRHLRSLKTPGHHDRSTRCYNTWQWSKQMSFLKPYVISNVFSKHQKDKMANKTNNKEGDEHSSITISSTSEHRGENVIDPQEERMPATNTYIVSYENNDNDVNISSEKLEDSPTLFQLLQESEYDYDISLMPDSQKIKKNPENERKRKIPLPLSSEISYPNNKRLVPLGDNPPNVDLQLKIPNEQDEIDFMFLSFSKTVKQFSPQRKALVKAELSYYIMQHELNHLREKDGDIYVGEETFC